MACAFVPAVGAPRELTFTSRLLAAERRRRGAPHGSRKLTCYWQVVLDLGWFRDRTAVMSLARDHGVARATAYRYVDEVIEVLAAGAPELPEALARAMADGLAFVILDGKVIPADRCREKTMSTKGESVDLWYSGKGRRHGGSIQAVASPARCSLWVSPAEPGSVHDITAARIHALQRSLRRRGERAFALLNQRWRASSTSPPALARSPESPAPPSFSLNMSTATSNERTKFRGDHRIA